MRPAANLKKGAGTNEKAKEVGAARAVTAERPPLVLPGEEFIRNARSTYFLCVSADTFPHVDDKILDVCDNGLDRQAAPVPQLIDGELRDIH